MAAGGVAASPSSKRRHQEAASRRVSTSPTPGVSTKLAMKDGEAGDRGSAGGTNNGQRLVGDGNVGRSIGADETELLASGTLEIPRVAKAGASGVTAVNESLADRRSSYGRRGGASGIDPSMSAEGGEWRSGNVPPVANALEVPGPIVTERRRRLPATVNGGGVTGSSCDPAGGAVGTAHSAQGEVDDVSGTSVMARAKVATGTVESATVSSTALSKVSENDPFSSQRRGDPPVATPRGDRDVGEEEPLLTSVKVLLRKLERNLDAARVLLPECHRFRKVVECISEAVGPGMRVRPRQVSIFYLQSLLVRFDAAAAMFCWTFSTRFGQAGNE